MNTMTLQQHAKLAQHYHNRHFQIACTQIIGRYPAKQVVMDYHAIYAKYLYHKRAAANLRAIEAQRQTEIGLLALGVVAASDHNAADWCRVCNTELGRGNCVECLMERRQQRLDAPVPAQRVKAANVQVGRTYYRHGDRGKVVFIVLEISSNYQRNSIAAYRTAQVKLANGDTAEKLIYASAEYVEVL